MLTLTRIFSIIIAVVAKSGPQNVACPAVQAFGNELQRVIDRDKDQNLDRLRKDRATHNATWRKLSQGHADPNFVIRRSL